MTYSMRDTTPHTKKAHAVEAKKDEVGEAKGQVVKAKPFGKKHAVVSTTEKKTSGKGGDVHLKNKEKEKTNAPKIITKPPVVIKKKRTAAGAKSK